MGLRIVLVLLAVLAHEVRPADACSPPRFIAPNDGATNVPTNLVEVITGNPFLEPGPYIREAGTDSRLPTHVVKEWGLRRLQFVEPLKANTTYELVLGGSVFGAFTTGGDRDDVAPSAITIEDFQISHAIHEPETSCGAVELAVSGVAAGIGSEPLLRVRVTGEGMVQDRMIPAPYFDLLSYPLTDIELDVLPGKAYDIEIWARDFAGNEGPSARFDGVVVRDCGVLERGYSGSLHECPLDVIVLPEPETAGCATAAGADPHACLVILGMLGISKLRRRQRARR